MFNNDLTGVSYQLQNCQIYWDVQQYDINKNF